jgi:hypothetical protein
MHILDITVQGKIDEKDKVTMKFAIGSSKKHQNGKRRQG